MEYYKKKILLIARNSPYPTTDGEKLRVYNIIRHLSKYYDITLIYRAMYRNELEHEKHLLNYCSRIEGVFIPPPVSHFKRLIRLFNTLKHGYPFICSPYYFPAMADRIEKVTENVVYDAVQIEHSLLFPYLDSLTKKNAGIKLVTLHNIDFIRFQRILNQMPFSIRKIFYYLFLKNLKTVELNGLKNFDFVLTMSEEDIKQLNSHGFDKKMVSIPNGVDVDAIRPIFVSPVPETILFVGSLDYIANKDGVLWFLNKVWPILISHMPKAKLLLVGRNPCNKLKSYQSVAVTVTGTVESVEPYYKQASVCIVPLRSGGGTRLKILEALAYGVPVVSTTLGCEGIKVENLKTILIADTPNSFAKAILKLCNNMELSTSISKKGRSLVEEQYSWRKITKKYKTFFPKNIQDDYPQV